MNLSMAHRWLWALVASVACVFAGSARADYFFDQGFVRAPLRSDYDDPLRGTAALPLRRQPCLFPDGDPNVLISICGEHRVAFNASNHYSRDVGPDGRYWTIMANNEPWHVDASGSGPPGQSLPIVPPGAGIMGFDALPIAGPGSRKEAHFVLVNLYNNPHVPAGNYAIPFLSLYADDDHGNGGVPGVLNNPQRPHTVTWISTLYDHQSARDPYPNANGNRGMWSHFFWVVSEWGGKPRMVFVNLMWNGITWSGRWRAGLHAHWNWPFPDSGISPGGDIAYMNAGEIGVHCRALEDLQPIFKRGTSRRYTVDLQALFRCASDQELFDEPMPTTGELPIRTVAWANEGTGWFFAWTSVQDMRMLDPAVPVITVAGDELKSIDSASDSPGVAKIRGAVRAACASHAACAASVAADPPLSEAFRVVQPR
jgi:hypothetical protein